VEATTQAATVVGDDDPMPVLDDPIDPQLVRALRSGVLAHRAEPDRDATVLHLGDPAGARLAHRLRRNESLDAALRVDVIGALLLRLRTEHEVGDRLVWLARPGTLAWEDVDAAWLSASVAAFAEAGLDLAFVVVTRHGWIDPRSGQGVQWKRLRDRRRHSPSRPSGTD